MIRHIFKKDCTILYPFAAAVAVLHFALMTMMLQVGRFGGLSIARGTLFAHAPDWTFSITAELPQLVLLASAFLIVAIVQQDAIPGVTQDWLVRPVSRRDLLLAKLVSVLVMVQAPIFLADLLGALLNGFPLLQSLDAAAAHTIFLLLLPILPVFAFAALTRNFMEAIVGATIVVVVWQFLTTPFALGRLVPLYMNSMSGIAWMNQTVHLAVILIGATLLLSLQYFGRKTLLSRSLLAALLIAYVMIPQVPLHAAFALEQRLSPVPGAGNSVAINFVADHAALDDRQPGPRGYNPGDVFILLPIRVTGLPDGSVLNANFSTIRLIAPSGETTALPAQMGFQRWSGDTGEAGKPFTYGFRISTARYRRLAGEDLRIEVDYSLSLLKLAESQSMPALGGDLRIKSLGRCGTRLDDAGGEIEFGCINAGPLPACATLALEYPPTHAQNPGDVLCVPDYSPFRHRFDADALSRFTEKLPFGDPNGVDLYPVKSSMLPDSRIVVRVYQVQDHFTRQLVIPSIHLRDWAAE